MRYAFSICILSVLSLMSCESDDDGREMESEMDQMEQQETAMRTAIPDPVFEQYLIGQNVDDMIDGFVDTENLLRIDQIVVDDLGITSLKGIEACPNLYNLWLQNNSVSTLDVSKNPKLQFLYADGNGLTALNVSNLPLLEKLSARNNAITALSVGNNTVLELLEINGNSISRLSLASNENLFRLDVRDNPLQCIEVNESQLNNATLQWTLDGDDELSLDCQ